MVQLLVLLTEMITLLTESDALEDDDVDRMEVIAVTDTTFAVRVWPSGGGEYQAATLDYEDLP